MKPRGLVPFPVPLHQLPELTFPWKTWDPPLPLSAQRQVGKSSFGTSGTIRGGGGAFTGENLKKEMCQEREPVPTQGLLVCP